MKLQSAVTVQTERQKNRTPEPNTITWSVKEDRHALMEKPMDFANGAIIIITKMCLLVTVGFIHLVNDLEGPDMVLARSIKN